LLQLLRRNTIQSPHTRNRRRFFARRTTRQSQTSAEWLRQQRNITSDSATFSKYFFRMHNALHRKPEDRLGVSYRVTTRHRSTGLCDGTRSRRKNSRNRLSRKVFRKRRNIYRHNDSPTHRKHVAASVRRRDRTEVVWVVNKGRKKVGRTNKRHII